MTDFAPSALEVRWSLWEQRIERELKKPGFMQDDIRCDPYMLLETIKRAREAG